jgi:exonuclease III
MSIFKAHIIALQDCGHIYKSNESKQLYGDYKVHQFNFSKNKNDTLAFIIDEGMVHHIMQGSAKFIENADSRTLVLQLTKIYNNQDFFIVNTYAPPNKQDQPQYFYNIRKFLHKHAITAANSLILGDLNDYAEVSLDRWSTKKQTNNKNVHGKLLKNFKSLKYSDIFRTLHPEHRLYSRVGSYSSKVTQQPHKKQKTSDISPKVRLTQTRIDYFLTSNKNITAVNCCTILDNYDIGSDHRPIFLSMEVSKNIPHIASLKNPESNTEENNQTTHSEPTIKYIKDKTNESKWDSFKKKFQTTFHKNEVLQQKTDNAKAIDEWVEEITNLLDETTTNTVGWQEKQDKSTQGQTVSPINLETFVSPAAGTVQKHLIPMKPKIKHKLFSKANLICRCISRINCIYITYAKLTKSIQEDPTIYEYLQQKEEELESLLNEYQQTITVLQAEKYSEQPIIKETQETDKQHRKKEIERQLGLYLQKAKTPQMQFPQNKVNKNPAEIVIEYNHLKQQIHQFQYRLLRKFRKTIASIFFSADMEALKNNPYHIFKMLRKSVNKSFQHKLDYILKQKNGEYQILHRKKEVYQEITETYEQIFNNKTTLSTEIREKWFTNLPKISNEDQKYLETAFTVDEINCSSCRARFILRRGS